jgi:hypothetical protein
VAFNKSIGGGVLVWMPSFRIYFLDLRYIFFDSYIFFDLIWLVSCFLYCISLSPLKTHLCFKTPLYKHRIGRRQHFVLFPFVSCGISVPPCISEHLAVYVFCIQSFGFSLCITFDDAKPLYYIDVVFMYTAIPCK